MTASAAEKEYRRKQAEFSRLSAEEMGRRNAIFLGAKISGGACPCHPEMVRIGVKVDPFSIINTMESQGYTIVEFTPARCFACKSDMPPYGPCLRCNIA